ncbi:MAG TPA: ribose 5-phosphate isomerase B [Terriglobales bacterium]|nr:ribose 5-phosphate isomerase B [Terriglobales bacterium]
MKIALGSDHAGFELKESVKRLLTTQGIQVDDRGTHSSESVDYPDFARAVGEDVVRRKAEFGILVCGTGIGMSMSANKIPGIRAAKADTEYEAEMARAHNDANVLCLGARVTDAAAAEKLVRKFLETSFEGGRHQRRVDKIMAMEQQNSLATDSRR